MPPRAMTNALQLTRSSTLQGALVLVLGILLLVLFTSTGSGAL